MAKDAKGHGSDAHAAAALANGHPKSNLVPVHGAFGLIPDARVIPPGQVHSRFGTFAPMYSKAASAQPSSSVKQWNKQNTEDASYRKTFGMTKSELYAKETERMNHQPATRGSQLHIYPGNSRGVRVF